MKTKIMLPVLAFVFAIGMSFTTEKPVATAWAYDGINDPIQVTVIGCESDDEDKQCIGQFVGDNTEYDLFKDPGFNEELMGGGTIATITEL